LKNNYKILGCLIADGFLDDLWLALATFLHYSTTSWSLNLMVASTKLKASKADSRAKRSKELLTFIFKSSFRLYHNGYSAKLSALLLLLFYILTVFFDKILPNATWHIAC